MRAAVHGGMTPQSTDTLLQANAYAVFRVMGSEHDGKLYRVRGVVFARNEREAIRTARGPFNVSPIVQLVARGAL